MKIITDHPCFNDKYMLKAGAEVEIVREFVSEGQECVVFRRVDASLRDPQHEEFMSLKHGGNLVYQEGIK